MEFHDGVLCAGFVNAHSHLELAYLRGAIEEGGGLGAFAEGIGRVRGAFSEEEPFRAMAAADCEMWEEGVDAVADIVNGVTSFAVKAESKIYYHNFAEVFGLRECNLERQRKLLSYPNTSLTPHSTYSVADAPFREVCGEGSSPLSIHFLESSDEAKLYEGSGALHEWYERVGFECDFLHHGSPSKRVAEATPRDRAVLLVHNCALSSQDIDVLTGHFTTPISWAMCPRSNVYISGVMPESVALLRARELNICIGTDSLASNHSLSMVEEMKMFGDLPLEEVLRWATINGAKALGIADRFGSVEVGKMSGIVNIKGVNLETMRLTAESYARRIV